MDKFELYKLLLRGVELKHNYILTHRGFINNIGLNFNESHHLQKLAEKLDKTNSAMVIGKHVFTPYWGGYNSGFVIAGIKISKIV